MNKPKKIAFDARFYNEAGPGRYVKNILEQLEEIDKFNTYLVFLKKEQFTSYLPKSSNFIKISADYPWYSFSEQILFLAKLLKFWPNLLYVPHFNIPILFPKKIVTAIPDIIMHSFSTEAGTTLPKPYFKIKKFIYKLVTKWAIFRSSYVIVPSMATLLDIQQVFNTSTKKLVYAPEGVDPQINTQNMANTTNTLNELLIKTPYILYVGSMYEHKNLERLINAFEQLTKRPDFTLNLVCAGKSDKFSQKIVDLVKEKSLENRIFFPGQLKKIDDAQMNTLRQNCKFYVFPSLKEGFSLTPLEAMVFNKACVISDIQCHKEIYQDAVLYFDPFKINDISDKIYELAANKQLQDDLIKKGQILLAKYNWKQTAQITLQTFNRVFNNG
jgi:glycosyltransferase involved in cell wall biosynthesis